MFKINPEFDDQKILKATLTQISKNPTLRLTNQKTKCRKYWNAYFFNFNLTPNILGWMEDFFQINLLTQGRWYSEFLKLIEPILSYVERSTQESMKNSS